MDGTKTVKSILSRMSLDEKISLLDGKNFWTTRAFPEYGLPSFEVADGPYGLRKQAGISDHMGWNKSEPSVAYVSGPGLAASWDRALARRLGNHLAIEARSFGVDILLGPAVNIVRSPLCGRNFEYYSEDPCLAGTMAAAYIEGVQENGVGACVKHFAANNQETDREYIDAAIDERALREIYLAAFEEPVKSAAPAAVMTALNKVNGRYCSENKYLLADVLRRDWAYKGLVMSDWSGVNNRAEALLAGLDLEMPCSHGVGAKRIKEGLENGALTKNDIDLCCARVIQAALHAHSRREGAAWDEGEHHAFARTLASRCMVLLKNDGALPLKPGAKIAVLGALAVCPRFQMEGSALVNPTRYDVPLDEIINLAEGGVVYGRGYGDDPDEADALLDEAAGLASAADAAVVFVGLPHGSEAEGRDRKNIDLPAAHDRLVEAAAAAQPNTVVVVMGGAAVAMPWVDRVAAIFECFLAGQAMGGALADLLYGRENPCAKLPVTFPKDLRHTPAHLNYPGCAGRVNYAEGVFVGYRYYDTKAIEPLFPFGHGLSYTRFAYSELRISAENITDADRAEVRFCITNTGDRAGAEIAQVYVSSPKCAVLRPEKELRDFVKVYLEPGQSTEVSVCLDKRAFSYYDEELSDWYAPEGAYTIAVGASCRDIRLTAELCLTPQKPKRKTVTGWSTIGDLNRTAAGRGLLSELRRLVKDCGKAHLLSLPLFDESEENAERVSGFPLRMVTLLTDNRINNDIMDRLIAECNKAAN